MEPQQRFRTLADAAASAVTEADYRALRQIAADIASLAQAGGDREMAAWADYYGGIALIQNNEGSAANRALRRALQYFREAGQRVMAARTMMNLAMIEIDINVNASEARRLYEEATPPIREEGDLKRLAILLGNLGEVCRLEGDYDGALRNGRESERLFRDIGDWPRVVWQLVNIAHYQSLRRDYAAAVASMRAAYDPLRRDFNPRFVALYFDVWVIVAAKLECWELAARLLGFVDRFRSEKNVPRLQGMLPWLSLPMERLSSIVSQDRLHELFLEGEALTIEDAQALTDAVEAG